MSVVKSGPAITDPAGPDIYNSNDKASFRLIVMYHIGTDAMALRLDVKRGREQFCAALSCNPIKPNAGTRVSAEDPLIVPSKGVEEAVSVQVDRLTLVEALEGLAQALREGG
jgi:hypothetical protein